MFADTIGVGAMRLLKVVTVATVESVELGSSIVVERTGACVGFPEVSSDVCTLPVVSGTVVDKLGRTWTVPVSTTVVDTSTLGTTVDVVEMVAVVLSEAKVAVGETDESWVVVSATA
jgi:hypothetical protein